jgi:hypothetical protein
MLPHDYEGLNDVMCLHVDLFAEQLDLWRRRNMGEWMCFHLARSAAQHRFPLEGEEVAQMDAYIATKFEVPKVAREPEGLPVPVMVVR